MCMKPSGSSGFFNALDFFLNSRLQLLTYFKSSKVHYIENNIFTKVKLLEKFDYY